MKVKYRNQIYRVMFNEEAKNKFKGYHQVLLWDDDKLVRLVERENPYKGTFVHYPFNNEVEVLDE